MVSSFSLDVKLKIQKVFMHKKQISALIFLAICIFFQSAFASISLRAFSRDEGLNEANIAKPRIYIQNVGDESISNFYCYYFFTTEDNKIPVLDDYYTPDAVATLENLSNGNYRVRFDFAGITLDPGQIKPNSDGKVVGLHYSDWSAWNKTNDFSNTGLATFTLNGNIPVYKSDGTLVYGNEPTNPGNPPQPPKVSTFSHDYAILSKEFTDVRDRVTIKGGDVGSGVYVEIGANAVVNGSVFSCRSIFLRSSSTINGDATAGEDVNQQNDITITGTVRSHAQLEISQISANTVPFGTEDKPIWDYGTIDLQPGSYKNLHAYSHATVIMHPGDYYFNEFLLETDVNIILKVSNTERLNLNVNSMLRLGDRTTMSFELGVAYPYSVKIYSAQNNQVFIGNNCQIYGNIICPDAEVHVYSNSNVNGSLYGKKVIVEPNSVVCKPPLLQDLWHSEWAFSPSFVPTILDYEAAVPDATVTLTVSTIVPDGTIVNINGQPGTEKTVNLTGSVTNIPIILNSSDQCGTTAYNLKVTKTGNYQIFVNDDSPCSPGTEDGNSWATAYKDLQQAIDRARVVGKEIWVAEGTYKPTKRVDNSDPRSATFLIESGIEIIGSFKGTETTKKPLGKVETTIFDGDLAGNDPAWFPENLIKGALFTDNVYHVLTLSNKNSTSQIKLKGVTVRGGSADGVGDNSVGAGILCKSCIPTIELCIIKNNISLLSGAGVYAGEGINQLYNCHLLNNVTLNGGGSGAFINKSRNCSIEGSIFENNQSPDTSSCNSAGGVLLNEGNMKIVNSIFVKNHSGVNGGAITAKNSHINIINCTFVSNSAFKNGQSVSSNNTSLNAVNTIFWNNMDKPEIISDGVYSVTYSCIKNVPGVGNVGSYPMFQDSDNPSGTDGVFGTMDDGLHLLSGSPCIDNGTTGSEIPEDDITETNRPFGSGVDIGAYEFAATQASKIEWGRSKNKIFYPVNEIAIITDLTENNIKWVCASSYYRILRIRIAPNKKLTDTFYGYIFSGNENNRIRVQFYKVGNENGEELYQTVRFFENNCEGKVILLTNNLSLQGEYPRTYVIYSQSTTDLSVKVPLDQFN